MDSPYRTIVNHYGIDNQLDILVEECGELIQAVSKYKRSKGAEAELEHLAEEMADVEIMLEQIVEGIDDGKGIRFRGMKTKYKMAKLHRQIDRINNGE